MTQVFSFFYYNVKYEIPIKETCPITNKITTETLELPIKKVKTQFLMKPVYFTGNIENEGTYQYAHGPGQIISMNGVLLYDVEWYKGRMIHGKIFFTDTGILRYDGEFYSNGEFKKGKLYRKFRDFDKKLKYEGSFDICSRFHGHGILTYPTGSTYDGNWKDGEANGHGSVTYPDGATYVGNFKNDKRHGHGILTYPNGSTYDGNWTDGKANGHGVSIGGGSRYVGNVKNDQKHGHGVYTYPDGSTYVGNFKNDKRHGYGVYTYSDGSTYVGYWKDHAQHGQGTYRSVHGHFEGFFRKGLKHGAGTELLSNGEKYIGNFQKNKRHGKGFLELPSRVSFQGSFEDGHIHGQGTLFRKNNRIWKKGHFENSDLHGKGIVFANNGTVQLEGTFIHGKFYDQTALMIQKYLDTRDSSALKKITGKEIQKYIETKFKTTYPVSKSKQYLLKQLIEFSKPTEDSSVEENYDEFGNEIQTKCLGNDGNFYDIESMFYLFQQNEIGEYTNIPYAYVENRRIPNFPRMGNGKLLDGYRIVFDNEDLVPPTLTRNNSHNSNINLIFDEEMIEI